LPAKQCVPKGISFDCYSLRPSNKENNMTNEELATLEVGEIVARVRQGIVSFFRMTSNEVREPRYGNGLPYRHVRGTRVMSDDLQPVNDRAQENLRDYPQWRGLDYCAYLRNKADEIEDALYRLNE